MKKRMMDGLLIAGAVALGTAVVVAPLTYAADAGTPQTDTSNARPFSLPSERIEARLAYIKTALKITSAQQKQWDVYADGLRKEAAQLDDVVKQRRAAWQAHKDGSGTPPARLTGLDRLQKEKTFLDNAETRLNNRIALYKVLTPDQQQIADKVIRSGFGGGQHKGGWGAHRGGPGGGGPRGGGQQGW